MSGDGFKWPDCPSIDLDPSQPRLYGRQTSSIHHVSEASESREDLVDSPPLYRIKLSDSQAVRKRESEGDGWGGETKVAKSSVSVTDLIARLHNGPNESQVLLAAKSRRQTVGFLPQPPTGGLQAPATSYKSMTLMVDMSQQNQRRQSSNTPLPLNLFPKRKLEKLPPLVNQASKLTMADEDATHSPTNEVKSVPSEMIIDDVVAAEKREITFQELGNESLMAAQSSSGAAIPLSSTPTMLSQSASDASPANTHPSGAISGPGKGPPSKPRLKMIRRSIYDDSVPTNRNFLEVLTEMRSRLGWSTELPDLGIKGRSSLALLKDKPDPSKNMEAALNARPDSGYFVYLLPKQRGPGCGRVNPYDLEVVSVNEARKYYIYYTASASNITQLRQSPDHGEEAVATPVMAWLWERRLFNRIFVLSVFSKFRIWKSFTLWKNNIRRHKNAGMRVVLHRTLFKSNEVLMGCLLHVRALCEAASSSANGLGEGEAAISLVKVDHTVTLTLAQFLDNQKRQGETALKQLNALRESVVDIVWRACVTVAELEGVTEGIHPETGEKEIPKAEVKNEVPVEKKPPEVLYSINTKYGRMPVYKKNDNLLPEKPTYAQITEWRKILRRLSDFLKLVDYVVIELLRRLVVTATNRLLSLVNNSFMVGLSLDEDSDAESYSSTESFMSRKMVTFNQMPSKQLGSKQGSQSMNSSMSSSLAQRSLLSASHGQRLDGKRERPSYVPPEFDFSRAESVRASVDIDEVLDEINRASQVIKIPESVISVQLVLTLPKVSEVRRHHARQSRVSFGVASKLSVGKSSAEIRVVSATDETKKAVTFNEPTYESDESDGDNDEDSDSSVDETIHEEGDVSNRFHSDLNARSSDHPLGPHSSTSVNVTTSSIVLSPTEGEMRVGFRNVITGFEDTVSQMVSMLAEPRLAVFYSPPKFELKLHCDVDATTRDDDQEEGVTTWPDTGQLFGGDEEYQITIADLTQCVSNSIDMVLEYSQEFNQYCKMVDQASKIDVEASMRTRNWSTDEFQHVLTIQTEQVKEMNVMRRVKRVGLIQVHTQQFCDSCLPYPENIIAVISRKLPEIALKKNLVLLTIIKGATRRLDHYPESVEEFVDHLSFLGKIGSEMPALNKEYNVVIKLYTIAKDFELPIVPEDYALYQTLSPSFQHLKTVILFAEAKKDDNIRKFSHSLDKLIHDIKQSIATMKNRVSDPMLLSGDTMAIVALEKIKLLIEEVSILLTKGKSYANYQERFGSSGTHMKRGISEDLMMMDRQEEGSAREIGADLSELERDLTLRRLLWESQEEWETSEEEWLGNPFDSLNVESLQKNVNRFTQTIYMLEKGLPHNDVVPRLNEKVMSFKQVMPGITSLRNPYLKPRHWEEIEKLIGRAIDRDKSFTLGNLLEMNLTKHKDKIQDISTMASNEATLERMLQKVIDVWKNTDFRLVAHIGGNVHIIAGADDILTQLEESQVTIGTIRGSRYVTPIKGIVEDWERKLALFGRTLDEWMTCQRNWLYLEQIFSTPDIQRQLPTESKLFASVDKAWKEIMRKTEDKPNALRAATASGVLEMLQVANTNLEKIQKCLEDYLETKRLVFPRFYFLSNDELLDILSQSKDPDAVQPHLDKCFGNIKSLDIKTLPRQPPTVKTMTSSEGEIITMPKNIRARGPVEQWLGSVENGMFDIVKKHLKLGLQDWSGSGLDNWVLKHPGQVILTVAQIMFNKDVLACFSDPDPINKLIELRDKVVRMLNMLAGLMSSNLIMYKRLSINALLTIDVHNRDIIFDMIENKITQKDDFEWTRQLRYEWDERSNNCNVLQSNATFHYGYEYLGCSPRLVITPLTDRCYLTLCGALHLHLGGSPAGPAGTGKTETVKDLAKAMGKQCVVFNCSEGLDFKMLAKFFSGLAQSGSWCCFDEFNRIDIEVLSVVAQQIHTIKTAKDQMVLRFIFEGREIKLNMTCGFFITMNPSYAGRVELPDNLKSLFRPVAMMVPDYALIAEIILFSEGFTAAKSLSTKLVNLYQLASKQLSQQDHYDFGMRAIKAVLVMAGQKKRHIQIREPSRVIDEEEETYILIHSLQDANMPKFLSEDVPLFESIMADLFPGIEPPPQNYTTLEKAISMAIRDLGLQYWPHQVEKVRQLYNQVMVRHGVMLIGPTGGGKTTTRNILQRALVLLPTILSDEEKRHADIRRRASTLQFPPRSKKGRVETFTLNPKCIKLGELYGETDMNTYEWTDGLIAIAMRRFAREHAALATPAEDSVSVSAARSHQSNIASPRNDSSEAPSPSTSIAAPESTTSLGEVSSTNFQQAVILDGSIDTVLTDWQWIILDGPVDTLWVENLNTVLDDSKVLCLANGERIALTPGMRLMFEVDDLSQASPATISRCAMVYVDPVDLGWRPYVKTWLQRLPKEMPPTAHDHLMGLFELSLDKGMTFIRQYRKYLMLDTPEMSLVLCLCNILQAFFKFMTHNGGFGLGDAENRPASDSESGHSRCSSSKADRRRKKAAKKQRTKDTHLTAADRAKKDMQNEKQYFLQRNPSSLTVLLGKLFVFAFTWSYGGNLKHQDEPEDDGGFGRRAGDKPVIDIANEFDNFIRELFEVEPPYGVRLPASSRSIYGYFVDMDTGNFVQWDILVPTTQSLIDKGAMITIGDTMGVSGDQGGQQGVKGSRDGEIVPTVDTVRYSFLAGLLLTNKNSVLLTGDSGVGKTVILENLLKQLGQEGGASTKGGTVLGKVFHPADKNQALLSSISTLTKVGGDESDENKEVSLLLPGQSRLKQTGVISTTLQFSAQTTADRTKLAITQKLVKKGKDILGAPKGKKVIVFLDDLNMPAMEMYGAQPPLELLRQFMDLGGFYDTHKLAWKEIHDVTIVAACAPPGGGRNVMSPRLLKHFCMLALPQPSSRSLQHIYQVVLGRYFQEGDYMPEVKESLYPLIAAAIAMYTRMCVVMRPTPAKIHYTFNIRDLSQVITGLLQADETVIVNSTNCAQLFAHEATRVFHDRLVDKEERAVFYKMLSDNLHDHFKVRWDADGLMSDPVLFADFLDVETSMSRRIYRPVTDRNMLRLTLEQFHMRLNVSVTSVPMVFFRDAIEHVLRAARVFRQPGGHMLMVGLDGTGKSSIVKLAAFIVSCELYKLTLTRGYGIVDFEDDIKKVCLLAGVKGHNTVFLITDADIVHESFLEDVNSILNSGEVPDLFDNEEIDGIAMDLEFAAVQAQVPATRRAIYQFFVQRVKKNLHIVLAMSPAGSKFRQRCRMNPSLINCCTIDWFNEWDREAMLAVARIYFQNADFICDDEHSIEELKDNVAQLCVDMHGTVAVAMTRFWDEMKRRCYITPSSYMELILTYSRMLKDQKTEFMTNRTRLQVGLNRLYEANNMVGTMQLELVTLGPRIQQKAKDTEMLLLQLEKDQEAVDQVREIVVSEEAVMTRETEIVQEYADRCQADLASVIPSLHAAITSLDSLDKSDVSEIRVYARPPELVIMVMAAVCTLLQEKTSWASAKQVLADAQFLKKLVSLDKNAVPEKVYVKLKRYTKHSNFNPEKVGLVSVACRSMCQWVLALENYHEVYKMAKPKQKKVKDAKEALALAQRHLASKQSSLAKIQAHFETLQQQYKDSVSQRESLTEHQALTALRLERASILIKALSNEKVRWEESVRLLDFKLKGLVGNTLVSAGMVAYVGPFTSAYRQDLASDWLRRCHEKAIPISDDYEFVPNLVDANQVLRWNNEGLPNDSNSTQNAIIMKKARKWPLLIDPQHQASQWIQKMESKHLKCVNASDSNYLHSIERAIRIGEAVLLQEVTEDLDPSLKPILLQNTYVKGGHTLIKIGDTEIEYNSNFRLYLATSLSNPHFLPAICIQVTLINFTVTFDALQEQLLSSVVKQEQPQLENDRSQLLQLIANDQMVLRELEDKSLSLLQKSQGHILDDHDLVETLQASKGMSEEMHMRVQNSRLTEQELNAARKKYLSVATRGAVLYFVLADLALVDVMYQFSLTWFYGMFSSNINLGHSQKLWRRLSRRTSLGDRRRSSTVQVAEPICEDDLNAQLQKMIGRLTTSIYKIASVALFAHHQLMFSFMLCTSIMRSNTHVNESLDPPPGGAVGGRDTISQLEWHLFLQGNIMAGMLDEETCRKHDGLSDAQRLECLSKEVAPPTRPKWISDIMWCQCQNLEAKFDSFAHLCQSIVNTPRQWAALAESPDPYHMMATKYNASSEEDTSKYAIVLPWETLTSIQRLILIHVLCPAALTATARHFVLEHMGAPFLSSGIADLNEMFEESSAKRPLIFILSPGSDPAAQLLRFAKELRGSTLHLDIISLGRGQGPRAEELISKAQILKGRWIFLQNCHLAASWMPRLQSIMDSFSRPESDVDPQFRLWLSSKPNPSFPVSILQTGLKMTVEPPQGLKANLLRSFGGGGSGAITQKLYEQSCPDHPEWHTLLFGLCFFNAVIHERKKYGRLGWNIPYEFSDSDLEVSVLQLEMLLEEQDEIPWPALWYLTGEVTYGGRVTDEMDRRCLRCLLQKFYHPNVLQLGYYYSNDKLYHPLPQGFSFSEAKAYIETLPAQDDPEVFGMNENAEKAYLVSQTETFIETILSVQPRIMKGLIGDGRSSDQIAMEIAADMTRNLPTLVDIYDEEICAVLKLLKPLSLADIAKIGMSTDMAFAKTKFKTPTQNKKEKGSNGETEWSLDMAVDEVRTISRSALFTVLRQETDRFNNLLSVIHQSLKSLSLAIKGEVVMSEKLDEAYGAILKQQVPAHWKQFAYESCKPLAQWVSDLILRISFFSGWAKLVTAAGEKALRSQVVNTYLQRLQMTQVSQENAPQRMWLTQPSSFWLSGFFFPQGFLTAVLQNHARKLGISVDSLSFEFAVRHSSWDTDDSLNDIQRKLDVHQLAFTEPSPPINGVLVFGLYIDGARWDMQTRALSDAMPGCRFSQLPQIHFIPNADLSRTTSTNFESPLAMFKDVDQDKLTYECPLYRTSSRAGTLSSTGMSTNFITTVNLPSDHAPEFWVMRGVALLCQLDS